MEAWIDITGLKIGSWLGYKIETNWTKLWVYALYSLVRPVASTLILVLIFLVIPQGKLNHPLFSYVYIGNAFFMYVYMVLFGISWVIQEDREHYQMLKYIFIAPRKMYFYLAGRGTAKLVITTFSVAVTLAFGLFILNINIDLFKVNYPLLIFALFLGLICIATLGVILASLTIVTVHHSHYLSEGIAGLFYLIAGAVFPIDVLPSWLLFLAKLFPLTYWIELMRRSMNIATHSKILSVYSAEQLLLILIASTIISVIASVFIYKSFERISIKHGLVDRIFNY